MIMVPRPFCAQVRSRRCRAPFALHKTGYLPKAALRQAQGKSVGMGQMLSHRYRDGQKVCQRVLSNLGRLDLLQETGQLDSLLRSGLRFSKKLAVLDAHAHGKCVTACRKCIYHG